MVKREEKPSENSVTYMDEKYQMGDKYFMIESANDCWKQNKDKIYEGVEELSALAAMMDKGYDQTVKHRVVLTATYGIVKCQTRGCNFSLWFKPDKKDQPRPESSFKFFRSIIQQHKVSAHQR